MPTGGTPVTGDVTTGLSEAVMAKADAPGKGADIKVVPCPGPKAEEDPVIRDIAEAAEAAEGNTERIAVVTALGQTPGLTESAIAPDVLAKLLPDDVVVLPELKRVGGSLPYRFAKRAFDVVSCSCAVISPSFIFPISSGLKSKDGKPGLLPGTIIRTVYAKFRTVIILLTSTLLAVRFPNRRSLRIDNFGSFSPRRASILCILILL